MKKHKIKMLGFDLDGTLLTTEKRLTDYTKEILKRAIERQIIVLPVTGRPLCGLPEEVTGFPGIRYAITANGGRIVDMEAGTVLKEDLVSFQTADRILHIFEQYDTLREIYYEGNGYAQQDVLERAPQYLREPRMAEYVRSTRRPVENLREKFEAEGRAVDKVQGVFARMEEREEALKKLREIENIEVTGALENNIEVNAGGVNKGDAVLWLGEYLHIQREEIMAFGDGRNDIQMMCRAGTGVAMANAVPEVQKSADYVTGTNDEDGAARFVEQYVLNEYGKERERTC